jgi:hypothetical protein
VTESNDEYVVIDTRLAEKAAWLVLLLLLAIVPFAGLALAAPWYWYPLAVAYLFFLLWLVR